MKDHKAERAQITGVEKVEIKKIRKGEVVRTYNSVESSTHTCTVEASICCHQENQTQSSISIPWSTSVCKHNVRTQSPQEKQKKHSTLDRKTNSVCQHENPIPQIKTHKRKALQYTSFRHTA
jgi:hypothetical protein